jgi:hypothetical protein
VVKKRDRIVNTEHLAPKLTITTIGSFDTEGKPTLWQFDGFYHFNSIGLYIDLEKGIQLYGGYTIGELKRIYKLKNEKPCEFTPLKFLIELSGSAKDCIVVPTCGRSYTKNYREIDMETLERIGLAGFVRLSNYCDIAIPHYAVGMSTCIQLELKYPWTKHALISNVPIKKFCRKGYFYSAFHVVKSKIISLTKEIKVGMQWKY